MVDCIIATVPRLHIRAPITGPAILKAVLQQHNFSCSCVDWNIDLWHCVGVELADWWNDTNVTFRYRTEFDKIYDIIEPYVKKWVQYIIQENPTYFGMSLFSQRSLFMCEMICKELKQHNTDIKIIIGGPYVNYCGDIFLKNKWCDFFIKGEGEEAIVALLNGDDHPGINGTAPQIDDLDTIPTPDYSDYNFSIYSRKFLEPHIRDELGAIVIYITGSRGCVRRCTFCDIINQWPAFRYRSAESILNEMLTQYKVYGIKEFYFTDSLINGNVTQFTKLCELLIEFYRQENITPFECYSHFICRPETQSPPDLFVKMSQAGFINLDIGIESISPKVRRDMKKYFSNEDIFYTLEQCNKQKNIKVYLLMMVGYPAETEEDFLMTYNFFTNGFLGADQANHCNIGYLKNRNKVKVIVGPACDLLAGAPLYEDRHLWGIEFDKTDHWYTENNDIEVRINRYIRLQKHLKKLGYEVLTKTLTHLELELERLQQLKI